MYMGLGCNACGVVGCRIIGSPQERLTTVLTNSSIPYSGRLPILVTAMTMFFAGATGGVFQSVVSTLMLTGVIMLGVFMTLVISHLLLETILEGMSSSSNLELPPYYHPQVGKVIVRSTLDRILFVLGRVVVVIALADLVIWVLANVSIGDTSILAHCTAFPDPFARLTRLDGYILMAFILGFLASEIVAPIIVMSYMATGSLTELESLFELHTLLASHG